MATSIRSPLGNLNDQQREILHLLAEGKTNEEISTEYHLTVNGIKYHVTQIYERLGVRNRVEAAVTYHVWADHVDPSFPPIPDEAVWA
jgi:DNA-binding NarL/FixJ family response regulator